MTTSATAPTREKAERAREDCEYVRSLLNVRQPQFAAALCLRHARRDCVDANAIARPFERKGFG